MSASEEKIQTPPTQVALVKDNYTLVINKGARDGVRSGQRFLVYNFGEEVLDPATKKLLGLLEVVRGTGVVQHLQESMATIKSDRTTEYQRTIRRITEGGTSWAHVFGAPTGVQEEVLPPKTIPFDSPAVGDYARPI